MDFTEAYPDRCSSVGVAARLGDGDSLKDLIAKGSCIDIHDNRGWTPLHEAAHADHYDCVKILLGHITDEEDVNVQTWEGETALFFAATNGNKQMIRQLIRQGGKPNICNTEESFPIHQAVAGNHGECVDLLLKKGANVNCLQWNKWSSLHEASYHGFTYILLQLLEAGAKTDARDDYGIAPVFTAAQYGHLDCLKLLIEYGSDPNATTDDDATPLYIATQERYTDCVEYLLQHGASTNIHTSINGHRLYPIHVAADRGHTRCLELLIPHSLSILEMPTCSINHPNSQPGDALHLAASKGHNDAVQLLLKAGCDPDYGIRNLSKERKNKFFATHGKLFEPVCLSALRGEHFNVARSLLDSGACICKSDDKHCLMFHCCLHTEATKLLLDYGADVDCVHMRLSPLSMLSSNLKYTGVLLKSGLRWPFDCEDKRGMCCKHWDISPSLTDTWCRLIQMIYCYVDRLHLCEHTIKQLQEDTKMNEILALTGKPHSLYHLCRVAITEHLGTTRAPKIIPKMDFLPKLFQDYLLYEDNQDIPPLVH